MSIDAAHTTSQTVSSYLDLLDHTAALAREAELNIRPDNRRPITRLEHLDSSEFRPRPSKDELRAQIKAAGGTKQPFVRFSRTTGSEFSPALHLRPKILDTWTANRVTQPDRSIRAPKDAAPPRFNHQPELFPTPKDELCHEMHAEWLKRHGKARERALNPVFHGLKDIDKARQALEHHAQVRQRTRDVMTRRNAAPPHLSDNTKKALAEVKKTVAITRVFQDLVGLESRAQQEETRDKERLAKAMSSPELYIRPVTPEGRARHLRDWTGPERSLRMLRESTPWREADDKRELAMRARARRRSTG